MSISPPVGALNRYLARLMSGKFYAAARDVGKNVLKVAPPLFELAKRFEEHAKGMVVPGTLFEEFGFNYIGPIDGHDLDSLIPTLREHARPEGPAVPARGHQEGPGLQAGRGRPGRLPRRRASSIPPSASSSRRRRRKPTFTQVFGHWLCDMAAQRRAPGRHHAGDARRLGHGRVREALPGALLRRRHRRAARRDLRRRPGLRGHEAGGRDLLDLPAARLRPADPRRRAPEPAGGVRARPRRPGRRRRRDACRRVTTSPTCAASRT